MKKISRVVLLTVAVLLAGIMVIQLTFGFSPFMNLCATMYHCLFPAACTVTSETIGVGSNPFPSANSQQRNASVWMGVYNGKIIFYPQNVTDKSKITAFYNNLCVFEGGTAHIKAKWNGTILGMNGNYIYYFPKPFSSYAGAEYSLDKGIHYYDISTGESLPLLFEEERVSNYYVSASGEFYILPNEKNDYYRVNGSTVDPTPTSAPNVYTMSNKRYFIEGSYLDSYVKITDVNGSQMNLDDVISDGWKQIYICKSGLLIHNEKYGDMLYFIRENNGEVVKLISVECAFSTSCVAVTRDYAFLSFSRYMFDDETDSIVPYPNDTVSGTYRIELLDLSVQKISDRIYTGLYTFDDFGVYACDENCQIYKLDYEGNVLIELLKNSN